MDKQQYEALFDKVRTAVTTCGRCDECPYGDENNECPKVLHKDIKLLLDAFEEQLEAQKAERSDLCRKVLAIEVERDSFERRLKHLLESETIQEFDAVTNGGKDYVRDISDLDEMLKGSEQNKAAEAIFARIAKNCESDMTGDELKKTIEAFDHLRQACRGKFTKVYW